MRLFSRLFTAVTITLGLALAVAGNASANERYGKQKVVYHINAVGAENMEIKVVLHGNGLGLLAHAKTNEALQGQVLSLKGQNVAINVCNNTLKGRKISYENDLFDVFAEDILPSGVAELSHLQMQGYTYIKP